MQSMLVGDLLRIRRDAPRVFAIYLRRHPGATWPAQDQGARSR